MQAALRRAIPALAVGLVLFALWFFQKSPSLADKERLKALYLSADWMAYHYARDGHLPVKDESGYWPSGIENFIARDGDGPEYRRGSDPQFQFCTTFATDAAAGTPWHHPAGLYCYTFDATKPLPKFPFPDFFNP